MDTVSSWTSFLVFFLATAFLLYSATIWRQIFWIWFLSLIEPFHTKSVSFSWRLCSVRSPPSPNHGLERVELGGGRVSFIYGRVPWHSTPCCSRGDSNSHLDVLYCTAKFIRASFKLGSCWESWGAGCSLNPKETSFWSIKGYSNSVILGCFEIRRSVNALCNFCLLALSLDRDYDIEFGFEKV